MKKYLLLLLVAARFSSHAQGSLNTGLLGRFPFDNSLTDATGNITNVSDVGVAYGPDAHSQANTALRLTGTGEVSVQPSGLLDFGTTGSFTFSVGFRTLSSGTQAFFSNQGTYSATVTNSSRGWSLGFNNSNVGKVYLNLVSSISSNSAFALATQASFNDGLWHTATIVINRSNRQIRIFVDGTAQALTYVSPRPDYGTVSGTTFTLDVVATSFVDLTPGYSLSAANVNGVYNRFGLSYNGWLDEARFYNRVLTDAEVQSLSAQVLATLDAQAAVVQVQVFPNPAGSLARVTVCLAQPVAASQLHVVDMLGRAVPVTITAHQPGDAAYELSGLATGLYLLQVSLPEGLAVRRLQIN
ncbi:MAG: T9SS type A sorting domain-containing protein [Janthinobacterium lividum]